MKRFLTAISFALFTISTAQAQSPTNWNGFYAGFVLGGASSNARADFVVPGNFSGPAGSSAQADAGLAARPVANNGANDTSFTGGIVGGYNAMFGQWLLGIEGEMSWQGVRARSQNVGYSQPIHLWSDTVNSEVKSDWVAALRPRVGAVFDRVLIYGTGGMAVTKMTGSQTQTSVDLTAGPGAGYSEAVSRSTVKVGWTAGGGMEYALSPRWLFRGEYLYSDFGKLNVDGVTTVPSIYGLQGNIFPHTFSLQTHVGRAGVTYRF